MNKRIDSFTLTELLIVLVIVGILILLAVPNLMPLISQAKGTEAKIQLGHILTLQKTYFYTNSKYTNDLNELGFEQENLVTDGGKANYKITIVDANERGFSAKAESVVDFDGDGVKNVWVIDQDKNLKETVKD